MISRRDSLNATVFCFLMCAVSGAASPIYSIIPLSRAGARAVDINNNGDVLIQEVLPYTGHPKGGGSNPMLFYVSTSRVSSDGVRIIEPPKQASGSSYPVAGLNDRGYAASGDLNNASVFIGHVTDPVTRLHIATRWVNGVAEALLPGPSRAEAMNELGQIAGEYRNDLFLWSNGSAQVFDMPPGELLVNDINDAGVIVGKYRSNSGDWRAVQWVAGQMQDLGAPGGSSEAIGINNAGDIILEAAAKSYVLRDGLFYNLTDQLNIQAGWFIAGVADINESGQIAATGAYQGKYYPVLLTPVAAAVPEPSTAGMVLAGLLVSSVLLRRSH